MEHVADAQAASTPVTPSGIGALQVKEVMSVALVTVAHDESLLMAWEILQRTGFHHLPVMDGEGRCLGLIERAELAVACAAPATAVSEADVRGLVTSSALVHDDASVSRAAAVMTQAGSDALPVLDSSGALVGLLTARDLVALIAGRPKRPAGPVGSGPVHFSLEPVLPYPFD